MLNPHQTLDRSIPKSKKCQQKPSRRVQNLLTGKGYASERPSAPKIPKGVQLPGVNAADDGDVADF